MTIPFAWVRRRPQIARTGKSYDGRTSPFWYDPVQFHELILAHGSQPLRSLIAQFDGCSGGKAGEIVAAAGLDRVSCDRRQPRSRARPCSRSPASMRARSARSDSDASVATPTPPSTYAIAHGQVLPRQRGAAS